MAIYDLGTASLSANGEVTGVGTTWKAPLTLIRVGATIVFKTEPVQIYTISEIISDTQVNVYNPNGESVPSGTGYAILAHDGITVQGLAQDVSETLRYYQSRETEVADAVDAFNNFDFEDFDSKVTQVNNQHGDVVSIGAQVSADSAQVTADKNSAAASAASASSYKDAAAISAQEAADYAASLDAQNLLRKDLALSDLTDKPLARQNLDVYSKGEIINIAKSRFLTPEDFTDNPDLVSDWAPVINACYEEAKNLGVGVLINKTYRIRSTVVQPDGVNVLCTGKLIASPDGNYSHTTAKGATENCAYILTTSNGVFNSSKSSSLYGLTLTYTDDTEPSGYFDEHIDAKGVVITDISNVYINNLQTFGFLKGGVDVGGVSGGGFEIIIDKSMSWIYSWVDSENVGFRCNVTDSTFKDVITVSYGIGLHVVKGGGNVFFNSHPWGYPNTIDNQFLNRQTKIHYILSGAGSTFYRPYIDTITKIDASMPSSRSNGGIGFLIDSWRSTVRNAEALVHPQEASSELSLVYLKGDSARNSIEFSNIGVDVSKYIQERVYYDSGYQSALFTNHISIPEYASGNLSNLTGQISLNQSSVASSGTYNIRRDGDRVDVYFYITVTSVSGAGNKHVGISLPRGLKCRYGATSEPIQSSCFGAINPENIGTIAVSNGDSVHFYYKTANGQRNQINEGALTNGVLEFSFIGRISN